MKIIRKTNHPFMPSPPSEGTGAGVGSGFGYGSTLRTGHAY
jgi:hypothetical protein